MRLQNRVDPGEEFRKREGLGQEVPVAGAHLGDLNRGDEDSRDDEDAEVGPEGLQVAGKFHAGTLRHGVIGDQQVDPGRSVEDVNGALSVSGGVNVVALVLKEGTRESANVGVVVDDEDGGMGFGRFQVRVLFFC